MARLIQSQPKQDYRTAPKTTWKRSYGGPGGTTYLVGNKLFRT